MTFSRFSITFPTQKEAHIWFFLVIESAINWNEDNFISIWRSPEELSPPGWDLMRAKVRCLFSLYQSNHVVVDMLTFRQLLHAYQNALVYPHPPDKIAQLAATVFPIYHCAHKTIGWYCAFWHGPTKDHKAQFFLVSLNTAEQVHVFPGFYVKLQQAIRLIGTQSEPPIYQCIDGPDSPEFRLSSEYNCVWGKRLFWTLFVIHRELHRFSFKSLDNQGTWIQEGKSTTVIDPALVNPLSPEFIQFCEWCQSAWRTPAPAPLLPFFDLL